MTKEKLLRTYLEDGVFTESDYLADGEAEIFNWSDRKGMPIIEVLKMIINAEAEGQGKQTIIRRANQLLDNTL